MRIIVVGAGPVGEYMIQLAAEAGHSVVLIEPDETRAERCAQNYDVQVLHAGIGEEDILAEAGADRASALVATTDDDSINLMAMVLGQEYEIANLTSTVNSRHRKPLFERLGVNTLVDPEILVARNLLDLTLHPGEETVTSLSGTGLIYELRLGAGSSLAGRELGALSEQKSLPEGTAIVLVRRNNRPVFVRDALTLAENDEILLYSAEPLSHEELSMFTAGPDESPDDTR